MAPGFSTDDLVMVARDEVVVDDCRAFGTKLLFCVIPTSVREVAVLEEAQCGAGIPLPVRGKKI